VLPILIYVFYFWIHLVVLYKSGNGDGFFSSAFQSQLEGNSLYNASMPRHLAYGAVITLKNYRTGGGYLHSHWHLYPEGIGARQQQVTAYSHKDENNKWIIKKYDADPDLMKGPIEFVKNGDLIRLEHQVTGRNLHSHRERAPVTTKHYQVTCYGENGTGDVNDVFKLELINGYSDQKVETVTSKIRLVHYLIDCAIQSHSKQLPKWGYEQMEVSCTPNLLDKNSLWNVEDNFYPRLPNVSFKLYAPSLLQKLIESHAVMLQGNAGLKPKEGEVTSRPWQWPINYRVKFKLKL
jgi:protein O-mannosyl-transferase 2